MKLDRNKASIPRLTPMKYALVRPKRPSHIKANLR
jgi:hypothetical protein